MKIVKILFLFLFLFCLFSLAKMILIMEVAYDDVNIVQSMNFCFLVQQQQPTICLAIRLLL